MKRFRPVLLLAFLLSPVPSFAFSENCPGGDWCNCGGGHTECLSPHDSCEEACGGGVQSSAPPVYDPEAARRQAEANRAMMEQQAHEWRVALNNEGVSFYKAGNWDLAIERFTTASNAEPDNALFKTNLDNALRAKADAAAAQAAQAERARQNADAMSRMGAVMGNLKFDGDVHDAPVGASSGLAFGAFASTGAAAGTNGYPPHGDPRIVDARNLPPAVSADIDKAIKGAYPKASPDVTERLKKAFAAGEHNDWKVANAWFQDALRQDPSNVGLQRFVILAQTPSKLNAVKAPPAPPLPLVAPVNPPKPPKPPEDEIIRFFNDFRDGKEQHPSRAVRQYVLSLSADDFKYLLARQLPDNRDLEFLFETNPAAALQLPKDEDIAFLFEPPPPAPPKLVPGGKN